MYGLTGAVKIYKAREVGKKFRQVEDMDYDETFATVFKTII